MEMEEEEGRKQASEERERLFKILTELLHGTGSTRGIKAADACLPEQSTGHVLGNAVEVPAGPTDWPRHAT